MRFFYLEAVMKTVNKCAVWMGLLAMVLLGSAYAMPLNSSGRAVIPSDLQQLISVDYRSLKDSDTAMQLKNQLLPDNIKQFEGALKGIGIDPDKDVDSLTFASFRTQKNGVQGIVVAAGPFAMKTVLKKLIAAKIKPVKYHNTTNIYPMDGGFVMTFLDDGTLLFGEPVAVKLALDTRDGETMSMDANQTMSDMMTNVDSAPVWSVLDQQGTQNMMRSALGDAANIADYESVKKRILGSSYTMDFSNGVNFDLKVATSDSMTAGSLSMLLKAGILFKKSSASAVEKVAMDNTTVDSDGSDLTVHFKANDTQFQSLMHSPLFAAVSH